MYKINKTPAKRIIEELKSWLKDEYAKTGGGFYMNWNVIEGYIAGNKLITIHNEVELLGYACWITYEKNATIEFFHIQPEYRNRGIGTILFDELRAFFISMGCIVIDLKCSPGSSYSYWYKKGFTTFPDLSYNSSNIKMFLPLLKSQPNSVELKNQNCVELWNCEPHLANLGKPKWIWNIVFAVEPNLLLPIIFPCNSNWLLRVTLDGKEIFCNKIKRLNRSIETGSFLYIRNLDKSTLI